MAPSENGNGATGKLDFELYFLSDVLKLTSLHYGFWDPDTASGRSDLDEVRRAQVRFREELISTIPEGSSTVLDVGAGIGDSSLDMANRGYDVFAISPDMNHEVHFAEYDHPRLTFECSGFETFDTDRRFDVLYFSESIGYIDLDVGLPQCRRLTKPGGHLLISSTFRSPEGVPYPQGFELADLAIVKQVEAAGFELVSARDITENVLPTMHIAHSAMTDYLPALMGFADAFLETRAPLYRGLLKMALAGPRKAFEESMEHYYTETNPDYFSAHIRYATLLFRKAA